MIHGQQNIKKTTGRNSFLDSGQRLCLTRNDQTDLGAHPSTYSMDTGRKAAGTWGWQPTSISADIKN
jgi:hypothetical protein